MACSCLIPDGEDNEIDSRFRRYIHKLIFRHKSYWGFIGEGYNRQADEGVTCDSESLLNSPTISEVRMVLRDRQALLRKRVGNQNTYVKNSLSTVDPVLLGALSFTWICLSILFRSYV